MAAREGERNKEKEKERRKRDRTVVDRLCECYPEGIGLLTGAVLAATSVAFFTSIKHCDGWDH